MKTSKELQEDINFWNDKLKEATQKLSERISEHAEAMRHEQEEQQRKMKSES